MRIAVLVTLVFMPLVIGAQEYGATIRGTMTGPEGERVLHLGCGLMWAMQRQNRNQRRKKTTD